MYYYIYDEFVQDRRYEKELLKIENRLADLGITGKVARLALFRDPGELIRDEVGRGISTVVAVGNDETVRKVLDAVALQGAVFGIIPLGAPNALARLLGLPEGAAACDVLSARIIETIDLGSVNGRRFITGIRAENFSADVKCDGKFSIHPLTSGTLEIRNLSGAAADGSTLADPQDGSLDIILQVQGRRPWLFGRRLPQESFFPAKKMIIESRAPTTLLVDGQEMIDTRFDIRIEPKRFQVITSKKRMF